MGSRIGTSLGASFRKIDWSNSLDVWVERLRAFYPQLEKNNTHESHKTRNRALMYLLDIYVLIVISFLPFSYAAHRMGVSLLFRLRFGIPRCSAFRYVFHHIWNDTDSVCSPALSL